MPHQPPLFRPVPPTNPDAHTRIPHDRPFLIQLRQEDKMPNGSFRPASSLVLGESLRPSGLLYFLAPEDVKSLLFLLTFLSPNGECQAALHQLAAAMRVPSIKAQRRMRRLVAFVWDNEPLVLEQKRESGLVFYRPHPRLTAFESWCAPEPAVPALPTGSRDAVIAHSRERYGRPREEVEREMAQRMGWDKAQKEQDESAARLQAEMQALTPHSRELLQRLQTTGLTVEQALDLLRVYDSLRIERQLQWLPYRHAKNPAGFLLAAIADNYEAPQAFRYSVAPPVEHVTIETPLPEGEASTESGTPVEERALKMPPPFEAARAAFEGVARSEPRSEESGP